MMRVCRVYSSDERRIYEEPGITVVVTEDCVDELEATTVDVDGDVDDELLEVDVARMLIEFDVNVAAGELGDEELEAFEKDVDEELDAFEDVKTGTEVVEGTLEVGRAEEDESFVVEDVFSVVERVVEIGLTDEVLVELAEVDEILRLEVEVVLREDVLSEDDEVLIDEVFWRECSLVLVPIFEYLLFTGITTRTSLMGVEVNFAVVELEKGNRSRMSFFPDFMMQKKETHTKPSWWTK
ncbi:hypothetical protein P7C70_g4965, partial [Phenoliferia sp. Uapishka_3]